MNATTNMAYATERDAFEAIIGYEEEKQELRQIADVLNNETRYAAMGVKAPRGLLITGEPGVGKSLMSECLIAAVDRPTFTCRKELALAIAQKGLLLASDIQAIKETCTIVPVAI